LQIAILEYLSRVRHPNEELVLFITSEDDNTNLVILSTPLRLRGQQDHFSDDG
jgi:hypothetical protein